jgi:hypothetical protein
MMRIPQARDTNTTMLMIFVISSTLSAKRGPITFGFRCVFHSPQP